MEINVETKTMLSLNIKELSESKNKCSKGNLFKIKTSSKVVTKSLGV